MQDEAKPVGNAALTAKILCQKHNTELSELDYSIKQSFDTLNEAWELYDARRKIISRRWTQRTFTIDGALLELWFLKTFINISHGGQWVVGAGTHDAGIPNDELVQITFGRAAFREKAGLYMASYYGEKEVAV